MKLMMTGLATGLLLAGAPAWADNDGDDGWRRNASIQQIRHWENHGDRHYRYYSERRHPRAQPRHWGRRYDDRRHHRPTPRQRHYYRDYSYGYPAPGAYVESPNVWFSWTIR
ncbi:MAG TPA: hypothetical protein VFP00_12605 [Burkholderiales bacterium]|nr:hypothetical protein [Burkholderiales bacterium]